MAKLLNMNSSHTRARFSSTTNNVFSGTLSPTQSINQTKVIASDITVNNQH